MIASLVSSRYQAITIRNGRTRGCRRMPVAMAEDGIVAPRARRARAAVNPLHVTFEEVTLAKPAYLRSSAVVCARAVGTTALVGPSGGQVDRAASRGGAAPAPILARLDGCRHDVSDAKCSATLGTAAGVDVPPGTGRGDLTLMAGICDWMVPRPFALEGTLASFTDSRSPGLGSESSAGTPAREPGVGA